jgi:hypothetical protein
MAKVIHFILYVIYWKENNKKKETEKLIKEIIMFLPWNISKYVFPYFLWFPVMLKRQNTEI